MRALPWLITVVILAACGKESQADASGNAAGTVTELPLTRGFYIAADTPCGRASNATLQLLRRDGIGGSRDFCAFKRIEQSGAKRFRVTQECRSGGEAYGGKEDVETVTIDYEVIGATAFRNIYEGGSASEYRYCAQPDLPEPWRDNDIADIIR